MNRLAALALLPLLATAAIAAEPLRPFGIQIVDDATGRGVPLVTLTTTNNISYVTDSAGRIAFDEPGLLGERVYFTIASPGYLYPADGFGYRGAALDTALGHRVTLKIHRTQIAERLYRLTGEGVYRDTVKLGLAAPLAAPLLDGGVMGQDSTQAVVFRGKIYWFWGDTTRAGYPLGHFGTAAATSDLPASGGLDPSVGVDLHYFVDDHGFSRPMFKLGRPGPVWVDAAMVVRDDHGADRLLVHYSRMKSLGERLEHGLAVFDDAGPSLRPIVTFPADMPAEPTGHAFRHTDHGVDYIYFANPYPRVRVKADWTDVRDPRAYEAFTPLMPGSRWAGGSSRVERDAGGHVVYGWKRDTVGVDLDRQKQLIAAGLLTPTEAWIDTRDAATGRPIVLCGGSVRWNAYLRRWVMIANERDGAASNLGEVWYAEADEPQGPWPRARLVATHPRYSFYNPVQHAFFDQHGGRVIYFEGTFSVTFSGNDRPVPRYDYNTLMDRLDLSDPRLGLAPPQKPPRRR